MKTGDFLNTLAGKIGKTNETALQEFVSSGNHIELPDEICNAVISELMSLEGAKNNSKVKAHFVAQALNGVDSEIQSAVGALGIDSSIFSDDKDTYAKMRKLTSAYKELLEKKPDKESDLVKEKRELHQKLIEFQKQASEEKDALMKEIQSEKDKANEQVLNYIRQSSLKGINWANKGVPEDIQIEFATTALNRAMEAKGVKVLNVNGKLELFDAKDPTLKYYENGKEVDYDSFKNKTLADYQLLAVAEPQPTVQRNGYASPVISQATNPADIKYQGEVNRALAGLKLN